MNIFAKGNALVAKGSPSDAVYVNNCLDEIIKQLSVNRQHIDLFLSLYIKILDRLFGEDVARSTDVSLNPMWVKGISGGWLRALMSVSSAGGSPYESNSQVSLFEIQLNPIVLSLPHIIACCLILSLALLRSWQQCRLLGQPALPRQLHPAEVRSLQPHVRHSVQDPGWLRDQNCALADEAAGIGWLQLLLHRSLFLCLSIYHSLRNCTTQSVLPMEIINTNVHTL
jgi:hypothetical protein